MADAKKTLLVETKVKDLASRDLKKVGKVGKKAGQSIAAGFIKAQIAIGGMKLAIRAVINVMRGLTTDVAAQGDQFAKTAQKIGVSVEALSGLRHAAELSGATFETLVNGMGLLAKNAFDVAEGTGEAAVAFEQLGIEATDARGELRPVEDLINDISDALSKMEDGSKKTALAQKLFGRSGKELIPLLNAGSKGIREMREEAELLGLVWTSPEAKAAEDFTDALDRFGKSIKGVKESIGRDLLVPLAAGFEKLAKAITANREGIVAFVRLMVKEFVPALIEAAGFAEKAFLRIQRLREGFTLEGSGKQGFLDFTKMMGLDDARMRMGADRAIDAVEEAIDARTANLVKKWRALFDLPAEGGEAGPTRLGDTLVTAKKEVKDFFTEFVEGGAEATEALAGTNSLAKQLGATMTGAATAAVGNFFDAITTGTASASEAFAAMGRDILKTLNRLAAHQLITQIFGAIFGATVPGLTTPVPPPPTALGGVVRSPQVRLVGEAGPEAIVPLSGGGLGGNLSLNFNIIGSDGQSPREIAASVMQTMRDDRNFRKFMRGSTRRGL